MERETDICKVRCVAQVSGEAFGLRQSLSVISGLLYHMVYTALTEDLEHM